MAACQCSLLGEEKGLQVEAPAQAPPSPNAESGSFAQDSGVVLVANLARVIHGLLSDSSSWPLPGPHRQDYQHQLQDTPNALRVPFKFGSTHRPRAGCFLEGL